MRQEKRHLTMINTNKLINKIKKHIVFHKTIRTKETIQ